MARLYDQETLRPYMGDILVITVMFPIFCVYNDFNIGILSFLSEEFVYWLRMIDIMIYYKLLQYFIWIFT